MKRSRAIVLGTAILRATGVTLAQNLKVPPPAGKAATQPARRVDAKAQMEQKAGAVDPNGSMQLMGKGIETMALMTQMMMDQLGLTAPPTGPASAPIR